MQWYISDTLVSIISASDKIKQMFLLKIYIV